MSRTSLLRVLACLLVFGAIVGVLAPRKVEASCEPCGTAACMFEGSCHNQYSQWCAHNTIWTCEYLGGFCPEVVAAGHCG